MKRGHPWVFGDSIKEQNREGEAGELAVIYDRADRFMAIGFYDPASPIRVRILHHGKPATIDRNWWLAQAKECHAKRCRIFKDQQTTGMRLINGESEGFPGLVVDRYAETLVAKIYSAAWLPRWDELEDVLREVFDPECIMLRMSRNICDAAQALGISEGFRGNSGQDTVVFTENGICFESEVRQGQKTGFFLDQRDNRSRIEQLAAGLDVLNVFSFSGGFSLYAARGGAKSVTDLDISSHALESARRNFALNADDPRIAAASYHQVKADAFQWISGEGSDYDLVIVDPPSLAKREKDRVGAIKAYERLNASAIHRLRRNGILVAASCSAHVSAEEFEGLIEKVANRSGRSSKPLWKHAHAEDHPASFAEARYLKAIALKFD